jgi:hypothetical protein
MKMQCKKVRNGSTTKTCAPATHSSHGQSVGQDIEAGGFMNIARKAAIALATAGLSLGLLGISAPAQADTTWGWISVQK